MIASFLRNKYNEILGFCHAYDEPVYITKNGVGDLVVLSNEAYERLCGTWELHTKLDEGLRAVRDGDTCSAADVFAELEARS